MEKSFNLGRFKAIDPAADQYERQLRRLIDDGADVTCIEKAVRGALKNLSGDGRRAFVIYGEPQSGKTEMMICLTAKLLDEGRQFIIHLLNDSVDLLGQNLGRFQDSGLAPSAQNYTEILDPSIDVKSRRYVIFAKKNAGDLEKLLDKIGALEDIVVIDDEADFASPNSKVNNATRTRINQLIHDILGTTGDYIGVTATPARLDLNNTFDNDSRLWVNFPPHPMYTGQDIFFPLEWPSKNLSLPFQLELLPDRGDDPKYARRALFGFLVNVSYLNQYVNQTEANYSLLVHTSGKRIDHKSDWSIMQDTLASLTNSQSKKFDSYVRDIWTLANERYPDADPDRITSYVIKNISRNAVIILNSDRDLTRKGRSATRPASLFTIVIGGNIVSRGVTFENLLSMFFTRDVKHKIQQDTYIQRARMFGARGKYLRFFELTIPRALYADWHRCFVFHKLALEAIREGKGSPVWLGDGRISAVSPSSIDRSTVDMNKGEMGFGLFEFDPEIDLRIQSLNSVSAKLEALQKELRESAFPEYLKRYILRTASPSVERTVAVHPTSSIEGYKDAEGLDKAAIERRRGLIGQSQTAQFPNALHHLKIFTNSAGKGRLFYKFSGSIQFIKNTK